MTDANILTVADLIERLLKLDPDSKVLLADSFGDYRPLIKEKDLIPVYPFAENEVVLTTSCIKDFCY